MGSNKKCTRKVPYVRQVIALYLLVKSCIGYDGLIQSETCSQANRETLCCELTDDLSLTCIAKISMIHGDILNCDLQPFRADIHCH
jgi:hypothetical protein